MEVALEVPERLQDVPSFVRTATSTKNLPGSRWVVANMQGELDDIVAATSRYALGESQNLTADSLHIQTRFGITSHVDFSI